MQSLEQVIPPQRKYLQMCIILRMYPDVEAIRCQFPAHLQAFSPIRLEYFKITVDLQLLPATPAEATDGSLT
jgi:hypothetical protein